MSDPATSLSPRPTLFELEREVELAIASFAEAGRALQEIRTRRLYCSEGHTSFGAYLEKRWGMSRAHAYRLIEAAEVASALSPMGDTVLNERQARELGPLLAEGHEAVVQAWTTVTERYERVTAKGVRSVVRERKADQAERTDEDRLYDKLRMQRHRLRRKVKPNEPPSPRMHPWEIAANAIDTLGRIRAYIEKSAATTGPAHTAALQDVDAATELVRKLAWGPSGD